MRKLLNCLIGSTKKQRIIYLGGAVVTVCGGVITADFIDEERQLEYRAYLQREGPEVISQPSRIEFPRVAAQSFGYWTGLYGFVRLIKTRRTRRCP